MQKKEKLTQLKRLNNITFILDRLYLIFEQKKELTEQEEVLRFKAKQFLKERKWNKYTDKTNKISISLTLKQEESIDMLQLKLLLKDTDIRHATKTKEYEHLEIITPPMRQELKRMVKEE